ncbi:MAG: hypothetical protein H6730_24790 [Deltaproteobacteria bacterium]|nr:hypothetical protein [Deltaproteobacteria bacterium]
MRRMLVLAAALGMMWAVERLRMDGVQASPDPLTLAAIGFVVLAAFTVGEIGGALKLPKVTGYIVSGVLLGPQVSDVLSERVVGEMATFNTLALGLIATTAGLELDLSAIRKVLRTLAVTVAAKVPLLVWSSWAAPSTSPRLPSASSAWSPRGRSARWPWSSRCSASGPRLQSPLRW